MVHDGNEGDRAGTFLVERYLPGLTEAELRAAWVRVQDAAEAMSADGNPIAHLSSAFIHAEESVFCLFEARSAHAVQAVSEAARFPFDRIAEVLLLRGDEPASIDHSPERCFGVPPGRILPVAPPVWSDTGP